MWGGRSRKGGRKGEVERKRYGVRGRGERRGEQKSWGRGREFINR